MQVMILVVYWWWWEFAGGGNGSVPAGVMVAYWWCLTFLFHVIIVSQGGMTRYEGKSKELDAWKTLTHAHENKLCRFPGKYCLDLLFRSPGYCPGHNNIVLRGNYILYSLLIVT